MRHKVTALRLPKNSLPRLNPTPSKKISEDVDRYDFLPIVKINNPENAKNAIVSVKEGKDHTKTKIDLGSDYDKDKREYLVADIVITQNSTTKIPLVVKRGYDPWGLQDEDGELSFVSSNSGAKLKFIESEDTDYKETAKKYDLKNAANGDVFVMEIAPTKLPRGTTFTITVYASDNDDWTGNKSTRKGICGKFNFKVVEKDVFMEEEVDDVLQINEGLVQNDSICFRVADKELASLFANPVLVLSNYAGKNGFDRMIDYKQKGYVKSTKYFSQSEIWIRATEDGYNLKPQKFRNGKEKVFLDYINPEIKNKIGYHVYYFVLLKGYHVLLLIVDNSEPSNPKFLIVDQIRIRKWIELEEVNVHMLEMTRNNYKGACDYAGRIDIDSSIQLWKLNRK